MFKLNKKTVPTILLATSGLLLGGFIGSTRAHESPVIQVAYAAYPDFNDLHQFQPYTDLLTFGTVIDNGVEFKDRGLRGGHIKDTDTEGTAMRMITLRIDSSHLPNGREPKPNPQAQGTIHVAVTDVGLNGISTDATLHDGDVIGLMLESIDVSESDLHGITKTHLYGVVGGRQGVFRPNDKSLWIQDADPFEGSVTDLGAAPLIEASRSEIIKAITGHSEQ